MVDTLKPLTLTGKKKTKTMKPKETAGKANIESIEVPIVAREMLVPPKKTKLVWGIVLAAFGLIGLAGVGQAGSSITLYIIICIAFMIGGVLLIVLYSREGKQYKMELQEAAERESREQRLADSRLELEQAKVDAELQQMKEEADAVGSCPACGAVSKGRFCEYCGSRIPD